MLYSPQHSKVLFAACGQSVITREVGYGDSRVAFVYCENFLQQVFLLESSQIEFDDPVYYRTYGGIRAIALYKAIIGKKPGTLCVWTLEFGGGVVIPLHILNPYQSAKVISVPS